MGHSHPSENKENLKKILKKLESSPSPPAKRKEAPKAREYYRVETQKSEPHSSSNLNRLDGRTQPLTKQSLDKLFDRKKDKSFIKNLIKAKIVEKLRKAEGQKGGKKASNLGYKVETLGYLCQSKAKEGRPSVVKRSGSR